jgi:hypothetical protein
LFNNDIEAENLEASGDTNTDMLDPNFAVALKLKLEPNVKKSHTDMPLPKRTKARKDIEEPISTKFNTDAGSRIKPKDLTLRVEPIWQKPKTLTDFPENSPNDLKLNELLNAILSCNECLKNLVPLSRPIFKED